MIELRLREREEGREGAALPVMCSGYRAEWALAKFYRATTAAVAPSAVEVAAATAPLVRLLQFAAAKMRRNWLEEEMAIAFSLSPSLPPYTLVPVASSTWVQLSTRLRLR